MSLKEIHRRAVSKNYFTVSNPKTRDIPPVVYDQRIVSQLTEQGASEEEILKSCLGWNVDSKILVYEDQVTTWFLDIAKKLKEDNEAGFVIILITCAQIESNQKYFEGGRDKLGETEKGSKKCFIRAIKRFFPDFENTPTNILEDFYNEVRCGLMHDAMTKYHVTVNASTRNPITLIMNVITNGMKQEVTLFENGKMTNIKTGEFQEYNRYIPLEVVSTKTNEIIVNPCLFLDTVENSIKKYIEQLKDPSQTALRTKFEAIFGKTLD